MEKKLITGEPVYDKLGNEITKGRYVVYPVEISDSYHLRIGKVLEEPKHWKEQPWFNAKELRDYYAITVIGITETWQGDLQLMKKKSTLQFPNRMMVVYHVPENYENLFNLYEQTHS